MTALAKYSLNASDGQATAANFGLGGGSLNALGQEINIKGATWMYVKASATVTAYQICIVAADGTIQPLTTALAASVGPVADVVVPQFAFASGDYGYAPVGPFFLREDDATNFKVSALTLSVAGAKQYTTGTAGSVDDTATTLINGLTLLTTVGGSTADTACRATTRLSVGGS